MPGFADVVIYPAFMLISVYMVLRYNWIGVVAGFFLFWLTPYLWGSTLSAFDHQRSVVLDHLWFTAGWIVSAGWCGMAYALRTYLKRESVSLHVSSN